MAAKQPIKILDDMVFRLSRKRSPQEVKLKALEWAVVTQLNGEKTVEQICEILALSEQEKQEIFSHLMQEGLLEIVGKTDQPSYIDTAILDEIEFQLKLHVGPVASVIIDDVLLELKRNRQNLEKKHLPVLVELLALEISNPEKRYQFQKKSLETIIKLFQG